MAKSMFPGKGKAYYKTDKRKASPLSGWSSNDADDEKFGKSFAGNNVQYDSKELTQPHELDAFFVVRDGRNVCQVLRYLPNRSSESQSA